MGYSNGPPTTGAQRAEVVRLRADGLTIRGIAREVFGDERFRGRVERILSAKRPAGPPGPGAASHLDDVDVSDLGSVAFYRALHSRRLAEWKTSDRAPSMNELLNLLRVELQLRSMEQFERLQHEHQRFAPDKKAPEDV